MLPFIVDKDWYQRYWLPERKRPRRRPVIRPLLRLVAFTLNDRAELMVRWVRTLRQQARDSQLINNFSDRDLRDIGLSRSDIPAILNGTYRLDQDPRWPE
jgi:uncharacterized protein YjiS (DUF1127 family)